MCSFVSCLCGRRVCLKMQLNYILSVALVLNALIITSFSVQRPKRDLMLIKKIIANLLRYNEQEHNPRIVYKVPKYRFLKGLKILPERYISRPIYRGPLTNILLPCNMRPVINFGHPIIPASVYIVNPQYGKPAFPNIVTFNVHGDRENIFPSKENQIQRPVRTNSNLQFESDKADAFHEQTSKKPIKIGEKTDHTSPKLKSFQDVEQISKKPELIISPQRFQSVKKNDSLGISTTISVPPTKSILTFHATAPSTPSTLTSTIPIASNTDTSTAKDISTTISVAPIIPISTTPTTAATAPYTTSNLTSTITIDSNTDISTEKDISTTISVANTIPIFTNPTTITTAPYTSNLASTIPITSNTDTSTAKDISTTISVAPIILISTTPTSATTAPYTTSNLTSTIPIASSTDISTAKDISTTISVANTIPISTNPTTTTTAPYTSNLTSTISITSNTDRSTAKDISTTISVAPNIPISITPTTVTTAPSTTSTIPIASKTDTSTEKAISTTISVAPNIPISITPTTVTSASSTTSTIPIASNTDTRTAKDISTTISVAPTTTTSTNLNTTALTITSTTVFITDTTTTASNTETLEATNLTSTNSPSSIIDFFETEASNTVKSISTTKLQEEGIAKIPLFTNKVELTTPRYVSGREPDKKITTESLILPLTQNNIKELQTVQLSTVQPLIDKMVNSDELDKSKIIKIEKDLTNEIDQENQNSLMVQSSTFSHTVDKLNGTSPIPEKVINSQTDPLGITEKTQSSQDGLYNCEKTVQEDSSQKEKIQDGNKLFMSGRRKDNYRGDIPEMIM